MVTTTTIARELLPTGTWKLDPVHSSIGFEVAYLGGSFRGQFRDVDARLVGGEEPQLTGSAAVGSVDVKDENLAAHLQSPDFFDAERHPELRFASHAIHAEQGHVSVDGEIEIKGVTKPVALEGAIAGPLTDPYGRERIGLELQTIVDRSAFGVSWNAPLPTGEPALAQDVTLTAHLYFLKGA